MLTLKPLSAASAERAQAEALYISSFPANERRPFASMLDDPKGYHEVFSIQDGDAFCGLICMITCGTICHIIYFAIREALRGKGYGSQVLQTVCHMKPDKRIIVDIERQDPDAANNGQRIRRKGFYLRNGFGETPVKYVWRNESYEILSLGGIVTDKEFDDFWEQALRH